MLDDQPARRLQLRVEPELVHHLEHDALVVARLLEILLPFLDDIVVGGAGERRRVHLDATPLGLQRLVQELGDLFVLHESLLVGDFVRADPPRAGKGCAAVRAAYAVGGSAGFSCASTRGRVQACGSGLTR